MWKERCSFIQGESVTSEGAACGCGEAGMRLV